MTDKSLELPAAAGPAATVDADGFCAFLDDCWRGRARAWQAFWIVLVAGHLVIGMVSAIVIGSLFAVASLAGGPIAMLVGLGAILLCCALGLAYTVFALVSVWRCAPNADLALLRFAGRAAAILFLVFLVLQFMAGIERGQQLATERRAGAAGRV